MEDGSEIASSNSALRAAATSAFARMWYIAVVTVVAVVSVPALTRVLASSRSRSVERSSGFFAVLRISLNIVACLISSFFLVSKAWSTWRVTSYLLLVEHAMVDKSVFLYLSPLFCQWEYPSQYSFGKAELDPQYRRKMLNKTILVSVECSGNKEQSKDMWLTDTLGRKNQYT